MAGPLVGWIIFYYAFKVRVKDAFIRTLLVNAIGTFIFFLINTLKGNVQPHWTLIAFAPLSMLTLIYFAQGFKPPAWFNKLAIVNIVLIILLRLTLIMQVPFITKVGAFKSFFGYSEWAKKIKQRAGDSYVIFPGGFQEPSKYNFYTKSLKGFAYDTRYYRRTQYDIWPLEDSLQHKRTLYIINAIDKNIELTTLHTNKGRFYTGWIDSTRTYQKVDIQSNTYKTTASPGQQVVFQLRVTNPYPYPINFSNTGQLHELVLGACFIQGEKQVYSQRVPLTFYNIQLAPHQSTFYTFPVKAPIQKGHYDLIFSLRTQPFPGGRNSRIVNFTVQ